MPFVRLPYCPCDPLTSRLVTTAHFIACLLFVASSFRRFFRVALRLLLLRCHPIPSHSLSFLFIFICWLRVTLVSAAFLNNSLQMAVHSDGGSVVRLYPLPHPCKQLHLVFLPRLTWMTLQALRIGFLLLLNDICTISNGSAFAAACHLGTHKNPLDFRTFRPYGRATFCLHTSSNYLDCKKNERRKKSTKFALIEHYSWQCQFQYLPQKPSLEPHKSFVKQLIKWNDDYNWIFHFDAYIHIKKRAQYFSLRLSKQKKKEQIDWYNRY